MQSPAPNSTSSSMYSLAYPQYVAQQSLSATAPFDTARDSSAGPNRSSMVPLHQRHGSISGGGSNALAASTSSNPSLPRTTIASGPYARPAEPMPIQSAALEAPTTHSVKASSTTSEFTKRKNWSQHIIDEIQDFMHVLNPAGSFMFATPSILDLCGWSPDELMNRPVADFLHPDDVEAYQRDFHHALEEGKDLTLYCRFRTKDERYVLFEMTGHPYYADLKGAQTPKCFFAMGRPYPSKNQAMLDSFLELKFENERLRQELQVMYRDIEGGPASTAGDRPAGYNVYGNKATTGPKGPSSVIDPTTGLVQAGGLIPSSSNTYGALGIGISANGTKGDGAHGEKKKKVSLRRCYLLMPAFTWTVLTRQSPTYLLCISLRHGPFRDQKPRVEEGEFVCRDCGTVDSPEWRKGPDGPKSLCNACGLRYAKASSKANKESKAEKAKPDKGK
ncbi:BZ3500_MvSof-1268-A1-R1_Chr4-2g07212 [Microbotryum saponariae]|uniref:BZ3500_MvSof-1268-A1-R1_Chr4-2g07212 protein n=1 Tax=Microbotryum saponariae TaxID=289078 RepID=A0A2X0NMC5_9BASI|nr:BZ3500_MvSof-1268-A1-R1_Chr4-2g07212 [Microbotryum saponariae]SDA06877.1 BZ3501_MvSof-1269-A2-R1_Chr4-2g06923 [Microbotryum saponariae]